jgi:hypothetical protein
MHRRRQDQTGMFRSCSDTRKQKGVAFLLWWNDRNGNKAAGTRFCCKFRVSSGMYRYWNFGSGVGRINLPSELYWTWWLDPGAEFLSFGPASVPCIMARSWCEDCLQQCCGYWKIYCSCLVWKSVIGYGTDSSYVGYERVSCGTDIWNSVLATCTDMVRVGSERVAWLLAQTSETVSLLRVQTWYVLVLKECRGYWHRHLKQCLGYVYRHGTCWFWKSVVVTGTDVLNSVLTMCTDMVRVGSERMSWLLAQTSETVSWLRVQTWYVLVLKECRGYWHRHPKQCLGYVYRHGTCWFWKCRGYWHRHCMCSFLYNKTN